MPIALDPTFRFQRNVTTAAVSLNQLIFSPVILIRPLFVLERGKVANLQVCEVCIKTPPTIRKLIDVIERFRVQLRKNLYE